jgi:hypothetical protein
MVKAYRAEWDGTLQPYALYVPRDYDPGRAWPLVVALHGAHSNHRHMLRRVFGLENRPGEIDEEASRNELPFPDVPALVVAPLGRGEIGVRRPGRGGRAARHHRREARVKSTDTGLADRAVDGRRRRVDDRPRPPEMFAALAPVCGVTDAQVDPGQRRGRPDL